MFNIYTEYKGHKERTLLVHGMARTIHLQHIDKEYNTVNFEDPTATLIYFKKLYGSSMLEPTEKVDQTFDALNACMNRVGNDVTGAQAHWIMRTAADNIHSSFRRLNQQTLGGVAKSVLDEIPNATRCLIELAMPKGDDGNSMYTLTTTSNAGSTKDSGAGSESYDALG